MTRDRREFKKSFTPLLAVGVVARQNFGGFKKEGNSMLI